MKDKILKCISLYILGPLSTGVIIMLIVLLSELSYIWFFNEVSDKEFCLLSMYIIIGAGILFHLSFILFRLMLSFNLDWVIKLAEIIYKNKLIKPKHLNSCCCCG